jgi:hypothetical protein
MSEDPMINFNEALAATIKETDELLLPLLRTYLNDVRDIRMAMGREVQSIIQSSRQLNELTKGTAALMELTKTIMILKDLLTPDMMEKLRRISGETK